MHFKKIKAGFQNNQTGMITNNWFNKIGWFYVPVSFIRILISFATIAFCVTVFIAIDRISHSVSDTQYGIFPYFVSAFTILFGSLATLLLKTKNRREQPHHKRNYQQQEMNEL